MIYSQPLGQTFIPNKPDAAAQSSSDNESAMREFQVVVSDHHIMIIVECSLGLNFRASFVSLVQEEHQLVS
jgi:hypothetical protein